PARIEDALHDLGARKRVRVLAIIAKDAPPKIGAGPLQPAVEILDSEKAADNKEKNDTKKYTS
ncbi:MAG TPA: hypothetical protein PLA85_01845, partial [Micropepsaceae bacterium]|nr:hypothetical protein [Micropepsaceae bacterium]